MLSFQEWLLITERRRKMVEYGYHITYEIHLSYIQEKGLIPGGDRGKGNWANVGPILAANARKGVFFSTKKNAVRYWLSLLNDPEEDSIIGGKIPVLLRFRLNINKRVKDAYGREAFGDSWYFPKVIPPQGIEYWSGKQWAPISQFRELDIDKFTDRPEKLNPHQPELWQRTMKHSSDFPLPKNLSGNWGRAEDELGMKPTIDSLKRK